MGLDEPGQQRRRGAALTALAGARRKAGKMSAARAAAGTALDLAAVLPTETRTLPEG